MLVNETLFHGFNSPLVLADSLRMFSATLSSIVGAIILISILLPWFLLAVFCILLCYAYAAIFYRASARELKRLGNMDFVSHPIFLCPFPFFQMPSYDLLYILIFRNLLRAWQPYEHMESRIASA